MNPSPNDAIESETASPLNIKDFLSNTPNIRSLLKMMLKVEKSALKKLRKFEIKYDKNNLFHDPLKYCDNYLKLEINKKITIMQHLETSIDELNKAEVIIKKYFLSNQFKILTGIHEEIIKMKKLTNIASDYKRILIRQYKKSNSNKEFHDLKKEACDFFNHREEIIFNLESKLIPHLEVEREYFEILFRSIYCLLRSMFGRMKTTYLISLKKYIENYDALNASITQYPEKIYTENLLNIFYLNKILTFNTREILKDIKNQSDQVSNSGKINTTEDETDIDESHEVVSQTGFSNTNESKQTSSGASTCSYNQENKKLSITSSDSESNSSSGTNSSESDDEEKIEPKLKLIILQTDPNKIDSGCKNNEPIQLPKLLSFKQRDQKTKENSQKNQTKIIPNERTEETFTKNDELFNISNNIDSPVNTSIAPSFYTFAVSKNEFISSKEEKIAGESFDLHKGPDEFQSENISQQTGDSLESDETSSTEKPQNIDISSKQQVAQQTRGSSENEETISPSEKSKNIDLFYQNQIAQQTLDSLENQETIFPAEKSKNIDLFSQNQIAQKTQDSSEKGETLSPAEISQNSSDQTRDSSWNREANYSAEKSKNIDLFSQNQIAKKTQDSSEKAETLSPAERSQNSSDQTRDSSWNRVANSSAEKSKNIDLFSQNQIAKKTQESSAKEETLSPAEKSKNIDLFSQIQITQQTIDSTESNKILFQTEKKKTSIQQTSDFTEFEDISAFVEKTKIDPSDKITEHPFKIRNESLIKPLRTPKQQTRITKTQKSTSTDLFENLPIKLSKLDKSHQNEYDALDQSSYTRPIKKDQYTRSATLLSTNLDSISVNKCYSDQKACNFVSQGVSYPQVEPSFTKRDNNPKNISFLTNREMFNNITKKCSYLSQESKPVKIVTNPPKTETHGSKKTQSTLRRSYTLQSPYSKPVLPSFKSLEHVKKDEAYVSRIESVNLNCINGVPSLAIFIQYDLQFTPEYKEFVKTIKEYSNYELNIKNITTTDIKIMNKSSFIDNISSEDVRFSIKGKELYQKVENSCMASSHPDQLMSISLLGFQLNKFTLKSFPWIFNTTFIKHSSTIHVLKIQVFFEHFKYFTSNPKPTFLISKNARIIVHFCNASNFSAMRVIGANPPQYKLDILEKEIYWELPELAIPSTAQTKGLSYEVSARLVSNYTFNPENFNRDIISTLSFTLEDVSILNDIPSMFSHSSHIKNQPTSLNVTIRNVS